MSCVLKGVPSTSDWSGPVGSTVKMFTTVTKGNGTGQLTAAEYAGASLLPNGPSTTIEFTILKGNQTLSVVCPLPEKTDRGELHEDSGDGKSQKIRELRGSDPGRNITIVGTEAGQ